MTKRFDSVKMMRKIREDLSLKYADPASQEKYLQKIRKKYMN